MIDTDNVKGGYCSKQEMIFYLNAVEEVKRLSKEISRLNKWADNVREYFGDEAMIDLYGIYGGEEE